MNPLPTSTTAPAAPTPELSLGAADLSVRAPRWRELLFDRAVIVPFLIAVAITLGLGAGLATLRQQLLASEERMLAALANALADQADSALAAAQTAMQATAEEIAGGAWVPSTEVAGAVLRARAAALPAARQMLLLDRRGQVLQLADDSLEQPAHGRADYFLMALNSPAGSAHIGAPALWPGEAIPWIPLSMPWYSPDGRRSGVIVVAADSALLLGGFERRSPAPDARLRVLRNDGSALLESVPASPWPEQAEALRPPPGVAAWTGRLDLPDAQGVPQPLLLAGHAMQRAPLAVVLSRDTRVVLANWRRQAWQVGGFALAALLVTSVLSLRHAREQRWREHSQRELQRERDRAARALAAAREGLWEWDPQGQRHHLSPRMRELLGFDADAALSPAQVLAWPDRVAASEGQRLHEAIDTHLRERTQDFSLTLRVTPPGLPPRHVRLRGQGLRGRDDQLLLLAGTAYDVSDEVAVSEAARRLDEQLQRARQFEALGALAGGVAHDFNNVLAAILGFGERARDLAPEGSALAGHVEHILSAGQRGKSLVARVLAFSRTGHGLRQPYRPRALVQEACTLALQDLPAQVRTQIELQVDEALELVGDGTAFFEAALNLLRNAVQAVGPQGELGVRLSTETVATARLLWQGSLRPGRWLCLSVRDDGAGIDEQHLPRLLEPFYSTRGAHGGTGLGLAVVHAAVRDAHGAIDLQTAPGQGTRIALYLPLPESGAAGPGTPAGAAWSGQGEVVLVVDDEPALVDLLEEHLAERGFEPRGFSDAEQAWQAFEAEPALFSAVVCDQAMPRLSGLELIERCRRLAPDVLALVVTAYGGTDFGVRARAAGAQAVLAKPLDWQAFDAALQQGLARPH